MRAIWPARLVLAAVMTLTLAACTQATDGTGRADSSAPGTSAVPTGSNPSTATRNPSSATQNPSSTYTQPELPAAKAIAGVQYKPEPNHNHTTGVVEYDTSPPTGGDHSPIWALCNGVVYDHQIANENAVHMLEHGAVWITYNPKTLPSAVLGALKNAVDGVDYLALSPYAGLKTPISVQAWNYQLFLTSPADPRLARFISALKFPSSNTPEPGASCSGSGFVASQSTPGHPYNG